jgi:hypothetical protein
MLSFPTTTSAPLPTSLLAFLLSGIAVRALLLLATRRCKLYNSSKIRIGIFTTYFCFRPNTLSEEEQCPCLRETFWEAFFLSPFPGFLPRVVNAWANSCRVSGAPRKNVEILDPPFLEGAYLSAPQTERESLYRYVLCVVEYLYHEGIPEGEDTVNGGIVKCRHNSTDSACTMHKLHMDLKKLLNPCPLDALTRTNDPLNTSSMECLIQGTHCPKDGPCPRDAVSKGHIVKGTHRSRDTPSKGRTIQRPSSSHHRRRILLGMHRPRDTSSLRRVIHGTHRPQGCIIQGTHRPSLKEIFLAFTPFWFLSS